MKKIAVILALLLPMLAIGQGTTTTKMKRLFVDTLYITKAVTDTSTLLLVMDEDGKIKVNRISTGTDYWTVATSLLQKIDTTTGLNIYTGAGADYSYIAQTANGQQVRATTIKRATGAGASVVLNNNPGYVNLQGTDGTYTDQIQVNQGLGYLTGLSSKNANNRMNLGTSGVPWGKFWIDSLNAAGIIRANGGNSDLWNTAYGWGNHAGLYAPISTVSSQWVTSGANIYYNSGNVGIGNTNPTDAKLRISTNSSNPGIYVTNTNGWGVYSNTTSDAGYFISASGRGIYAKSTSGFAAIFETGNVGITTTNPATALDMGTGTLTAPSILGGSAVDSKVTIRSTSGAGTAGAIAFQVATGTNGATKAITVLNGGNVGIGTTAPGVALDVAGVIRASLSVLAYNNSSGLGSDEIFATTNKALAIVNKSTLSNSAMSFWTKNTEAVRIDPYQRVGIGTTAPAYKLDVSGTARVTAIAVSTTDTTSVGYPVGTIQMRITAADTSAWLLIRTDGSITARWKKLTP